MTIYEFPGFELGERMAKYIFFHFIIQYSHLYFCIIFSYSPLTIIEHYKNVANVAYIQFTHNTGRFNCNTETKMFDVMLKCEVQHVQWIISPHKCNLFQVILIFT